MVSMVILASLAALVASAPAQTKTIINVDGPDGHQHVQTGEPGKAVSGYFTSQSRDGVEQKTMYEADDNGFRATGAHLPVAPVRPPPFVHLPVHPMIPVSGFGYRYGPQNNPFFYSNVLGGTYGPAKDYLSAMSDKTSENESSLTPEKIALARQLAQLTPEEVAALTESDPLTARFAFESLNFILLEKLYWKLSVIFSIFGAPINT